MIARTSQPYGPLLALLREKRGLTQSQLAALGGITRKAVSRYETGTRSVPEKRFASLCAVLGYTPPEVEAWLLAFRTLPGSTTPSETTESEPTGLSPELARASRKALAELKEAIAAEAAPRFGRTLLAASWRRERKQAEALGRKLLTLPARLRPALLVISAPYRSWAVIEWLCHASEKAAARDPRLSLNLAKVALQATETSTGPEASKLRSYAWGYIGNAQRVGNDYRSADRAFAGARSLWDKTEPKYVPALEEWRLFDLEASLRRDQKRWLKALALLDRAAALAPPQAQGRILLKRGALLEQMDEHAESLATLAKAENLIDSKSEPRSRLILRFNQAANLIALERICEAEVLLPEIQVLANQQANGLDLLRTLWLRGRIDSALNRLDLALGSLRPVVSAFAEARLAYDAALAGLDLAWVRLQRDEHREVRELAEAMAWIFDEPDFAREGLTALGLFCEAARREAATAALARETWIAVRRAAAGTA